jgi:hypothetical protein
VHGNLTSASFCSKIIPEKFTDDREWVPFKNALKNYLGAVRGAGQIPMLYLVRSQNDPDDLDPAVMNAPLEGPIFNQDNRELFCLLDSLLQKGPGETITRRHKARCDGRSAFLELDSHFSGGAFKTLRVKRANEKVRNKKFTCVNLNFTFESYRRKFADAFRDLEDVGQAVPEQKKVLDFMENIVTAP